MFTQHMHAVALAVAMLPALAVAAPLSLDEALDLMEKLWSGQPVVHHGQHYHFRGDGGPDDPSEQPTPFLPRPVAGLSSAVSISRPPASCCLPTTVTSRTA